MNYLSRPDRRAETEPAEERRVEISVERADFVRLESCPWCRLSVRKHGPEAIARCEAAFRAEMDRGMAGPRTVRDVLGEPRGVPPSGFLRRGRSP